MAEAPNPPLHPKQKAIEIIEKALNYAQSDLSHAEFHIDKAMLHPDSFTGEQKWNFIKKHIAEQLKVAEIKKALEWVQSKSAFN